MMLSVGLTMPNRAAAQCPAGLGATATQLSTQSWSTGAPVDFTSILVNSELGRQVTNLVSPTKMITDGGGAVYLIDPGKAAVYALGGTIDPATGLRLATAFPMNSPMPGGLSGTPVSLLYAAGVLYVGDSRGNLITPFLATMKPFQSLSQSPLIGLTFDGQYLWASTDTGTLFKLRPATPGGIGIASTPVSLVSTYGLGHNLTLGELAFDGRHIWATSGSSIIQIDPATGAQLGSVTIAGIVSGLIFDGTYLWTGNAQQGSVTQIDPVKRTAGVPIGTGTGYATYVAFDGRTLWVPNSQGNTISRIRACDGSVMAALIVGSGPQYEVFDGNRIWITYRNSATVSIR